MNHYANSINYSLFLLHNREPDLTGYKYYMETNTSSSQRIEDDRITYLNKGKFILLPIKVSPIKKGIATTSSGQNSISRVLEETVNSYFISSSDQQPI